MEMKLSIFALGLAVVGTIVVRTVIVTENQMLLFAGLAAIVAFALAIGRMPKIAETARGMARLGEYNFALLFACGVAIALSMADNHFSLLMFATVLIFATAGLGLTLQFGYGGVINLAGAAFFGVGAYSAAVLGNAGMPPLLVLVLAAAIAAFLGCLLILPILRTAGHYAALITIAFGLLFRSFLEVNDTLGGPQGLKVEAMRIGGWSFDNGLTIGSFEASFFLNYVLMALVIFVLVQLFVHRVYKSWIGLSLDIVREDETAAAAFGMNTSMKRIMAFTIGNAIIGIAGAQYAMMQNFVAPNNYGFSESLLLIAIVILGGLGNLWGVLPAAILVLVAPEKFQEFGEYRILVFSLVIVMILRFSPSGMFPQGMRSYARELGPK